MLALPKSDAAADTRVCIGTITTRDRLCILYLSLCICIARAGTPNGLLFVRAKTQASDLLVTDPACVSGLTGGGEGSSVVRYKPLFPTPPMLPPPPPLVPPPLDPPPPATPPPPPLSPPPM